MHEHGMCEGLVELIGQRASGRRVTEVRLRVGSRHAVLEEAFDQAFTMAAAGTVAQDAKVDLVVSPATVDCRSCGKRAETADSLPLCPQCDSVDVTVSGGDELVLESLQYEQG